MKQKARGVDQWDETIDESPTMPITDASRPAPMMVRRQWGSVSIRPVSGLTNASSWCSQPAWFSSEPWWWSRLNRWAPVSSAAAPMYTVDLPHQAPISTKAPCSKEAPARSAARKSASPSSSGMNPVAARASENRWSRRSARSTWAASASAGSGMGGTGDGAIRPACHGGRANRHVGRWAVRSGRAVRPCGPAVRSGRAVRPCGPACSVQDEAEDQVAGLVDEDAEVDSAVLAHPTPGGGLDSGQRGTDLGDHALEWLGSTVHDRIDATHPCVTFK